MNRGYRWDEFRFMHVAVLVPEPKLNGYVKTFATFPSQLFPSAQALSFAHFYSARNPLIKQELVRSCATSGSTAFGTGSAIDGSSEKWVVGWFFFKKAIATIGNRYEEIWVASKHRRGGIHAARGQGSGAKQFGERYPGARR